MIPTWRGVQFVSDERGPAHVMYQRRLTVTPELIDFVLSQNIQHMFLKVSGEISVCEKYVRNVFANNYF